MRDGCAGEYVELMMLMMLMRGCLAQVRMQVRMRRVQRVCA